MPPSSTTGVISAQNASRNLRQSSAGVGKSPLGRSRRRAITEQSTINASPINTPGITPAMKSLPTETSAAAPYTTIGSDGGMIGPIVAAAAVRPAAMPIGYLASRIARISTTPRPPASATADPDMPAKIIDAMTLAWQSPPRSQPTITVAKPKMRWVTPALFITCPIRMNSGAATKVKELAADTSCCTMMIGSMCCRKTNAVAASAIVSQIGGPRKRHAAQTQRIVVIVAVTAAPP